MNTFRTGCGLELAQVADYVLPLTPDCHNIADAEGFCMGCGFRVREGYTLAAMVGHRHFARDVRSMLDALTECDQMGECVAEVLDHFGASVDHTHVSA